MADKKDFSEFRNIPITNPNVAKIADMLNLAKKYADQYYVKENVPLIGGMKLGETLLGQAPEEIQRWGEGDYPLRSLSDLKRLEGTRTNIWKTGRAAPTFDVAANVVAPLIPAVKTYGKVVGPTANKYLDNYLTKTGGKLHMMTGEGSKFWNPDIQDIAVDLEKKGAKPTEIREATGLVRGLDGHWRDELSDQFAKMKENPLLQDKEWAKDKNFSNFGALHKSVSSGNQPVKVKDVLEHQDLYDAYPHLRNIEVVTHKAGSDTKGAYYPGKNKISIAEDLKPEEAKSTLLHEITHDIQNFEGWNHGANSKAEIKKYYDRQNEIIEQIRGINAQMSEANKVGDTEKYHQLMAIRQPLNEEYLRIIEPEKLGMRDYMNNAGEAEARLVQARMNLPPEELLKHFPYEYTGTGKGKYGLDIHPDEAIIPSNYPKTINQPSESVDYRGHHKAPGKDEDNFHAPAHELDRLYPEDVYGELGHHYYGSGGSSSKMDREVVNLLREARGNPDHEITIYRAVPSEFKDSDINKGDWVTPTLEYAHNHGLREFDSHHILEKRVPARHLFTNADSLHEFGYDPFD
jgi:hypothetical protein